MIKVKNVRAGIVIIADAGLKLAPGETVSVDRLTAQMQSAIEAGLLARIDSESDGKSKPKNAPKVDEPKMSATGQGQASVSTVDEKPVENDAAATSQSDEKPSTPFAGAKNASK